MKLKPIPIKTLTVTKDKEREQWIKILQAAANFHYDMSGQFTPEIVGDVDMEKVATMHRGWAKAIQEAAYLVEQWEIIEEDDIKSIDGN
jgi:hypothetical protein